MEKIITFIIPAYNVQKYLEKCLDSFLNKIILDKLEIIIINDGSIDGTELIAKTYVNNYPESYRLVNKTNGGHGSTINIGTKIARGKFFKVIDADDWVITDNLVEFVVNLENCLADVVITPFHMIDMKTGDKKVQSFCCTESLIDLKTIVKDWSNYECCMVFHSITYRTVFYRKYNHLLPNNVYYEDQEYSAIPFCHAQKIAVFDLFLYQYMIGNVNQSISAESQSKRISHIEHVLIDILNYYNQNNNLSQTAKKYLRLKLENIIMNYYLASCVYEKDKTKGLLESKQINKKISKSNPDLIEKLKWKYFIYILMNRLHVSSSLYHWMLNQNFYRMIKFFYNKYVR